MNLSPPTPDHVSYPRTKQVSELDRLLLLTEVADSVDGFTSLEETIAGLCQTVLSVMDCNYACVRLPDERRDTLRIVSSSDDGAFLGDEVLDLTSMSIAGPVPGHRPPSVDAFLMGRLQVVCRADATGDAPWQQHFRRQGIVSMLSLPLVRRSTVLGVLNCYWIDEFAPQEAQLLTLEVVGRLSALAIESARRAEVMRARNADAAAARSHSDHQRAIATSFSAFQAEVAECCAQPPAAALSGITRVLADHLLCAVAILDEQGVVLASDGPVDSMKRLLAEPHGNDNGTVAIDDAHGPLGTLVLGLEDSSSHDAAPFLDFVSRILVPVLARRVEDRTSSRVARPYALVALCSGMLSDAQRTVAADVLGIGTYPQLGLAVVSFASAAEALAFSSRTRHHVHQWNDVIASVAVGAEAILLLDHPAARHRPSLDVERHPGLLGVGLSRQFTGISDMQTHLTQARYAAATSRQGDVVSFADLGTAAHLCVHVPRKELETTLINRLGALTTYDGDHRTDLVQTLETYVSAGGSVDETASRLVIHRNTVHQRLRRVTELTDLDLRSYNDISETVMLLQWKRYLDATAHQ
ncbi:GAF domain-containing protein [Corynebacterium glyciniphilum]|uniref:GAF domain-containing protein n=1 Tax=Corynebacterium glyciniphilum TaxID=1404244 RepID=UPI00164315D3|nr:GAF domain-containing protein [Corynebacterium glyciniphilum]